MTERLEDESVLLRRGPYDGREIFCKPLFRSARFLATMVFCFVCLTLVVVILVEFWNRFSESTVLVLGLIGFTVAGIWWRAWRYLDRLRQLYVEGSIQDVKTGSPLDIALGVAAGVAIDTLVFSLGMVALLLVFVLSLAAHCPPK